MYNVLMPRYPTIITIMLALTCLRTEGAAAPPQREASERPAAASSPGNPSWKKISNYRGWKITSLSLTGLDESTAKTMEKSLETGTDDAVLYERTLRRDISRIRLFLSRRGWPYSSVTPSVVPGEEAKEVSLTLDIDPGPPVVVESVKTTGMPESLAEEAAARMKTVAGAVFTDDALAGDEETIVAILMREGYARAGVTSGVRMIDSTRVVVEYEVSPGEIYYFDRFSVSGASEDLDELALASLNIRRGERFSPKTMREARDNLSALQLFGRIRISLVDTAPDSLEMVVELSERKYRSVELAGGYWSDDGFSGRVRWRNANLFRKGRGSSLELSYTQYKQSGMWMAWWPALLKPKLIGTLRVVYDNISEDSYDKTAPGAGITFAYSHTRRTKSLLGYMVEWAKYDIYTTDRDEFEDPNGPVGFFLYRFVRDGTDDRLNPTRGTYSWLRLEYGPSGGISNSDYLYAEFSGSLLIPVARKTGLALNLRLGSAVPLGSSTTLLPDKRLYAGGSISHRGFQRRKLGPLDENGLPLGGELMTTGFIEFRFPLFWKLRGAAFMDVGQVWRKPGDFSLCARSACNPAATYAPTGIPQSLTAASLSHMMMFDWERQTSRGVSDVHHVPLYELRRKAGDQG